MGSRVWSGRGRPAGVLRPDRGGGRVGDLPPGEGAAGASGGALRRRRRRLLASGCLLRPRGPDVHLGHPLGRDGLAYCNPFLDGFFGSPCQGPGSPPASRLVAGWIRPLRLGDPLHPLFRNHDGAGRQPGLGLVAPPAPLLEVGRGRAAVDRGAGGGRCDLRALAPFRWRGPRSVAVHKLALLPGLYGGAGVAELQPWNLVEWKRGLDAPRLSGGCDHGAASAARQRVEIRSGSHIAVSWTLSGDCSDLSPHPASCHVPPLFESAFLQHQAAARGHSRLPRSPGQGDRRRMDSFLCLETGHTGACMERGTTCAAGDYPSVHGCRQRRTSLELLLRSRVRSRRLSRLGALPGGGRGVGGCHPPERSHASRDLLLLLRGRGSGLRVSARAAARSCRNGRSLGADGR